MWRRRKALIVFMRYPEPGKVKTRLARELGDRDAASVYEKLARRTLGVVSDFRRSMPDVEVLLFYSPEDREKEMAVPFPGPWELVPQHGEHLGQRMDLAVRHALSQGYGSVVLIGTDISDIAAADLERAFEIVGRGEAALGPAADGGFYLIGLDRPCSAPFRPELWRTGDICRRTASLIAEAGLGVRYVERRRDIDRPEDVRMLEETGLFRERLSVVVPTLSPVERLEPWLHALRAQLWPGDEIVVVIPNRGGMAPDGMAADEEGTRDMGAGDGGAGTSMLLT